ncbi:MAG: CvpA family protein [Rhodohalobacter sp.]
MLDLLILLPIAYFAYKGFTAGFIQEVLSIVGIILAVFITFAYMKPVSAFLEAFIENTDTATIIAGLLLFIGTIAVVQTIGLMLKKFLELVRLNVLNRLAGLCFGALKSAIVISGFLWLFAGFNLPAEETRNDSLTYFYIIPLAPATFDLVSTAIPNINGFIETIEEAIQEDNPIRNHPFFD